MQDFPDLREPKVILGCPWLPQWCWYILPHSLSLRTRQPRFTAQLMVIQSLVCPGVQLMALI